MVWRSSTQTKATQRQRCLNLRNYCLFIQTTQRGTSWPPRRSPKPTAMTKRGTCLRMASHLRSARAILTRNLKWKACWRSWERNSLRRLRHPKHRSLHHSRKQLIQLHDRNHRPRHDHFPLLFPISVQRRSRNALRCNPANGRWADFLQLLSSNRIRAEVGLHIPGAYGEHIDVALAKLNSCRLSHRVHRKLASRICRAVRQRNVPGNTGDVDDRSRSLFLHNRNHCLHPCKSAEQVGFKQVATRGEIHLRNRVDEAVPCVVDPNVDSVEMLNG